MIHRLLGEDISIITDKPLQLLLLANIMVVLSAALISPILEAITGPFQVSTARVGLLITAFGIPAVVLIPVGGIMADRYGRKPVLSAGLLLFGVAGASVGLTTNFTIALLLRFFQGVGYAGTVPVIVTIIGDTYNGSREVTGQGLRITISGFSQAVFPILAGVLVIFSWRYPFFLYALAIPPALAIYLYLDVPQDSGNKSSDNPSSFSKYLHDVYAELDVKLGAMLIALGVSTVPVYAFLTYNSIIVINTMGGSPQQAGVLVAVFSLMFAMVATQTGRIVSSFRRKTIPLLAGNISLGFGLVFFAFSPSFVVSSFAAILMGLGVGVLLPLYRSIITNFAPHSVRGAIVSLGESMVWLFASLTPLVMGVLILIAENNLGDLRSVQLITALAGVCGALIGIICVIMGTSSQ